jgi:hypothetical protein
MSKAMSKVAEISLLFLGLGCGIGLLLSGDLPLHTRWLQMGYALGRATLWLLNKINGDPRRTYMASFVILL